MTWYHMQQEWLHKPVRRPIRKTCCGWVVECLWFIWSVSVYGDRCLYFRMPGTSLYWLSYHRRFKQPAHSHTPSRIRMLRTYGAIIRSLEDKALSTEDKLLRSTLETLITKYSAKAAAIRLQILVEDIVN